MSSDQRTRRAPPAPPGRGRSAAPPDRRRLPLVALLIVVVAVLLVGAVAITALGGDDDVTAGGTAVAQVQPVTVTGAPLPSFAGNDAQDPAVGATAPVVDGLGFDGTAQAIGGATDRPTLVMFVAHWCPHCQREVPLVVGWRADGTIPEDIDLVAVSTGVESDLPNYPPSAWLAEEQWPGGIIADDAGQSAAAAYGLPSYPFFVALDAQGRVVGRGTGELDQAAIEELVGNLQAG